MNGYNDNGDLWYKVNHFNGKEHGLYKRYWSNGNLRFNGNYVNGKRNGLCEVYHSNGKLYNINYYL